ncbi:MAG TPA: hypothetical protein VKT78_02920, partial [Fimbriimonadaceae bacterium]|nr:hypothetical protein [Fimbriimonadaceae bacterium]
MTDPNLELHGIDAPLEAEIVLRAGPFEAIFEPTRAYLRRVRIHGVESVRVVYLHARAPDWSTVVPAVSNLESSIGQDRFELTWTGLHRKGEINFEWKGTLTGTAEGITYRCEGVALSEFKTNRTGMCALIPREFQGLPATIRHPDETESAITMPTTVSPTEPVRLARSIELGGVKLTFEGDVYGAEDQRNWSDASFKAYSMRGRGGAAYTLMKGEKLTHSLRIEASKTEAPGPAAVSKAGSPLLGARLDNDHDDIGNLPVDFFRVELPAGEDEARHLLDHARGSGRPLQIVAPHGGKAPDTRDHETLILMNAKERPSSSTSAWLGAGAFSEFNMGRHEAKGFDGLEVTVTPQVH